ncbi:MAG: succinylglutamate desuccinylase/aspartoacylase family protein [Candidatus Methylomirabilales bacterium]
MTGTTRIYTDVDYEKDGKQVGWLYLPYSVTRSAYGNIAIPIAVFKNGTGPGVLLMAGNHGDEYEGQVGLCKLVRSLDPGRIRGRIVVLPAVNLPAALAGARVSPLDIVNFNRAFPGDPNGTPTYAIAHYVDSVLFPMVGFFLDLHSGGSSLDYLPFVSMRVSGDAGLDKRTLAALEAFGAPLGMVWGYLLDTGFSETAAHGHGLVTLGGEFGGGGSVSPAGLRIVERGIQNFLVHAGCLPPDAATPVRQPTRLVEVPSRSYFALAPDAGLFEPLVELGADVRAGQACGQVHFVDDPARPPVPVSFAAAGTVVSQRHFGRVERGDCVAHLATDYKG